MKKLFACAQTHQTEDVVLLLCKNTAEWNTVNSLTGRTSNRRVPALLSELNSITTCED